MNAPRTAPGAAPPSRRVDRSERPSEPRWSTRWRSLAFLCLLLAAASASAGEPHDGELYQRILGMDRMLFDAFNACDLETFETIIAQDLEFYDDRSGLNTDREVELASFRDRCRTGKSAIRRELALSGVEVYALGETHAMQTGEHTFHAPDGEGVEHPVAVAKFIHIWDLRGARPQVVRVVSYEHRDLE